MPIDPSIPLSVQPMHLPSPAELMTLKDLATRSQMNQLALAAEQRRQKADVALRAVYADPTSRDDKGSLTPDALGKIEAIDPQTGMQVRSQMALAAQREAQTRRALAQLDEAHLNTLIKKNDMLHSGGTAALQSYKDAVAKGIPEPEARAQAQGIYSEQLETLAKSGVFSEEELRAFPTSFDPQKVEAGLSSMLKAKDYFNLEEKRRQDAKKAPTTRTRLEGTREVQEEWDPATQAWKPVGSGPRFKPEDSGKPVSDIGKLREDLQHGRITKDEFDAEVKKRTAQKDTAFTLGDKMNPTMRGSVELDIREIDYGLDQVKKLAAQTTGPFFDDTQHGNALTRLFKRSMTSSEQQEYETLANRFAMAIASVQSMGRGQISDAKVAEAKKLVPMPGDSKANVERKLATIQRIKEFAQETLKTPIKADARGPADDVQDVIDFFQK